MSDPAQHDWDFDFISAEMAGPHVVAQVRFRCGGSPVCTKEYRWRGGSRFDADAAVAEVRADLTDYASAESNRELHAHIKAFADSHTVFRVDGTTIVPEPPPSA